MAEYLGFNLSGILWCGGCLFMLEIYTIDSPVDLAVTEIDFIISCKEGTLMLLKIQTS